MTSRSRILFPAVLLAFVGAGASAQTVLTPGNDGGAFSDPDRLVETLIQDDRAELDEANAELVALKDTLENETLPEAIEAEEDALASLEDLGVDVEDPDTRQENIDAAIDSANDAATEAGDAVTGFDEDPARGERLEELAALPAPTPAEQAELDALTAERALLVETQEEADERVEDLGDANRELGDAVESQEMAREELENLDLESGALQQAFDDEVAAVEEKVAALDEEQLVAFNRAFNNAIASGLALDIDAADLEGIEDFNRQQINAFTKAYESEARFLAIAERTGQTEKFEARAEAHKAKFLAKLGPVETDEAIAGAGQRVERGATAAGRDQAKAARASAKGAAKGVVKGAAKAAARAAAKDAAKLSAKSAAKGAAKKAARDAARQAAKENPGNGKGNGKAKGKVKG